MSLRVLGWAAALAAAAALVAGAVYALAGPSLSAALERPLFSASGTGGGQTGSTTSSTTESSPNPDEKEERPSPQELRGTPEAAAYTAIAGMPGIERDSVEAVYRSRTDPSWASVHFSVPDEAYGNYVVFVRQDGELWEARRSIRADEPNRTRNELPVLSEVPRDLVYDRYAETRHAEEGGLPKEEVEAEDLPRVEPPPVAKPQAVRRGSAPEEEKLRALEEEISGYDGVAGVYVRSVDGEWGYGVRPDESFFSASVIKVPVMVAVFRRVEQGELSLEESYPTKESDWAAGAGTLQYEEPGKEYTLEEYLQKMMAESDNVAANALIRLAGGPEYVNAVARDLGARNTLLYQPISSERAAVPALDNRTTPRDTAKILAAIASGEAASPESCERMLELLGQNPSEDGIRNGLPEDATVKNKGGWLFEVYNDAAVVEHDGERYVISIFSQYGPATREGAEIIDRISEEVRKIQEE